MPTSAPGSSRGPAGARAARAGFTIIELMVVVAVVALAAALVSATLRDPAETRLDNEAARLASLLESARAGSRASGLAVLWVPQADAGDETPPFRFVGLPAKLALPTAWIDQATRAEVVGGAGVVLGPDAILPPQRIVLRLDDSRRVVASDGLSAFAVLDDPDAALPLAAATP